jgi:hypothetical protein
LGFFLLKWLNYSGLAKYFEYQILVLLKISMAPSLFSSPFIFPQATIVGVVCWSFPAV